MSLLRFARPRFLLLSALVLLAAFAASGGSLSVRDAEALGHGDNHFACWVTGVLKPHDNGVSLAQPVRGMGWGEPNEFVIDYSDYANGQPPPDDVNYQVEEVRMSVGGTRLPVSPGVSPQGDPLYECDRNGSGSDHPCEDFAESDIRPRCRAYVYPGENPDPGAEAPFYGSCILDPDGPHRVPIINGSPTRFVVPRQVPAFFFSYPEMVDYTFAMGYEHRNDTPLGLRRDDEINDIRTRRIIGLFDSNLAPDEDLVDGLGYIPWGYEGAQAKNYYLERRSVSHFAGTDPITGFSAGWYTEGNPAGGIALDPALFMTDQHSAQAELLVQAEASMGRGHRVIQGNQQLSGIDLSLRETQVCRSAGNGVTCTSTSEASSEPVVVWAPFNSTDTNSGETGRNELTDGVMRVGEYNEVDDRVGTDDRRVDGYRTNPKLTAIYKSVANSYLDIKRPPSGGDEIRISLILDEAWRNDYIFNIFGDADNQSTIPAFGRPDSAWTYAHYAPGLDRPGRDTALNEMIPGTNTSGSLSDKHLGYRQPRLEWGFENSAGEIETETVDHIRWPVNLQDLNWYLYRLPESVPGDPQWLLWTNYHGRTRLAQSGFGQSTITDAGAAPFLPGALPGKDEVSQPADAPGNRDLGPHLPGDPVRGSPVCYVLLPEDHPEVDDKPLLEELIHCEGFPDWGYGAGASAGAYLTAQDLKAVPLLSGQTPGVYLPFGVVGSDDDLDGVADHEDDDVVGLLTTDYLVKQGSEHPVGNPYDENQIGHRRLNQFDWTIQESSIIGNGDLAGVVGNDRRRFGLPDDPEAQREFLRAWPAEAIDPHLHYLMVVTFYERGLSGGSKFTDPREVLGGGYGAHPGDPDLDSSFSLPKRILRRVVCRILIQPSGIDSDVPVELGIFDEFTNWFAGKFGDLTGVLAKWLGGLLKSISTTPGGLMGITTNVACTGIDKLDQVRGGDRPVDVYRVDSNGTIVMNSAARSKIEGQKICGSVASPGEDICDSSVAFVLASQGRCTSLPQLELRIARTEFIEPTERIFYRRFFHGSGAGVNSQGGWSGAGGYRNPDVRVVSVSDRVSAEDIPVESLNAADLEGVSYSDAYAFSPLPGADDETRLDSHNIGLTRVYVEWSHDSDIRELIDKKIHGYLVRVVPDHKVAPWEPGEVQEFVVPKVVRELNRVALDDDGDLQPIGSRDLLVQGITFGGLHWYPEGDVSWGSDSLVRFWEGLYHPADSTVAPPVPENPPEMATNLGVIANSEYRGFNNLMGNLPIALGFRHTISIAPYHVEPGVGISVGPFSDPLPIEGDTAACLAAESEWVDDGTQARILDHYDCKTVGDTLIGAPPEEFRPGILSLTGTEICTDIFTTTEGIYTWDNPIVKQGWRLMWIIAGAVLFSLLVWQGLRMTYDIWIDPQPIIGFRELVPRFLLAVLLAAASLVICRIILVIASDLTCFVAQMTGMSMWGSVGYTFAGILEGYIAWGASLVTDFSLTKLVKAAFVLTVTGFFVVLVSIFILYLFVKVFLAMLMRLPLLAVLIVFAPLAFAFYASDSTSHWTKKWVSIFLGTTFQQVVVLMVLFIGSNLLHLALAGAVDSAFGTMITGLLMSLLVLALADKVPSIVNPAGQGLFASFGDMAKMGMTGAMVGVGVAGGAVAGGIGAMRGGGTVGVNAASRGGGGGGGDDGGSGGGAPGAPGGGPGGSPRGGGGGGGGTAGGGTGPMGGLRGSTFSGARNLASGIAHGAAGGAHWGQRMNTRIADVSGGNAFYSHSSRGDDAARQMSDMRGDYRNLSSSLRNLDNTISQRYPPAQTP